MKKVANNFVNKEWARLITNSLTSNSPDIHTVSTTLLTVSQAEVESMKTPASQKRHEDGLAHVIQGLRYGWTFGIAGRQIIVKRLKVETRDPRIRAIVAIAIRCGIKIGLKQLDKMRRHQPTNLRHKHDTQAALPPTPAS